MANEEVLGPRKTMFVIVIVVGCFAVLWPRILSPLVLGSARDQLKPNKFDREAGCCEVMFASEMAVLELVTAVCSSAVGASGHLSPYSIAECRKSVNETCGLDIAAFLKRSENVGKTTKMLLETMKSSNSSCLKENFGVPVWSLSSHVPVNSWSLQLDKVKQERPPIRGAGPHPALRERGRAIPPGAPKPPSRVPVPLPPHIRPPPIPGMRPPLGSAGGPQQAPKSSMGFVMPIYTICIIVFFVYTLSKIVLKRAGTVPYDQVAPDPQFRRRVFRDVSATPEPKFVVSAISGLVAEVQQQMQASYDLNQQRQEQDQNHTRPYTNGAVPNTDNTPVRIIATEYVEPIKEEEPEIKEKDTTPEPKDISPEPKDISPEPKDASPEPKDISPEPKDISPEPKDISPEPKEVTPEPKESSPEPEESPERDTVEIDHKGSNGDVLKGNDDVKKVTEDFISEAQDAELKEKQTTPELLEEALQESEEEEDDDEVEPEKSTVKHEAESVQSIYLQTDIPQQSKVLVAEFAEDTPRAAPAKHSPLVVSGKMTLSLIQDSPRETPERDAESTVDDFTTASALTQPAEKKEDDLSDDEEIEIEEIEEEVLEEEEVEELEEEEEEHHKK